LNRLLHFLALVGAVVSVATAQAAVGSPNSQRFTAADFHTADGKPLTGGALNADVEAVVDVTILTAGEYAVRISAEAIGEEPVSVTVTVDGASADRFEAPAGSPTPETTVVQLSPGAHTLGLRGTEGAIRITALELAAKSLSPGAPPAAAPAASPADPYLWLEEIQGEKALAWVRQHNDATAARLTARPDYAGLYHDALAVLDSGSRIPEVEPHGRFLYNLWRDAAHPRGLYRRTTLSEFQQDNPRWETVIDIDALARTEGQAWAFNGAVWRQPDEPRCLVRLSPGGGDAVEVREFDPNTKSFVAGGFVVPTAKSQVRWRDADTLFVASDFGPGSLTTSGYPRSVRLWRRGTPLPSAAELFTAEPTSVSATATRYGRGDHAIDIVTEGLTFWARRNFHLVGGALQPLPLPATTALVDAFQGRLVARLKEDWQFRGHTFASGSVLLVDPNALRGTAGTVEVLVVGGPESIVSDVNVLPDAILVTMLENVRGRLYRLTPKANGWERAPVTFPDNGTLKVVSHSDQTGEAWVQFETFTDPPALYRLPAGATAPVKTKAQAPAFDGARFETRQFWATSADGTKIPYFVVGPRDLRLDGRNPTWMFAYGGFEIPLTPAYSGSYEELHGAYGKLWLERGGAFVLANIRGGGEFGPGWHTSVLKEKHVKCFEDFEAVARDLATRKITSPARLGIEGRSNGGLLVAATMLRHPELYGAVVCGNPLLDLQRYHRLLAGASWMAEYGDPDRPEEWAFIAPYSPYQNVKAGRQLPPILFYTTTLDDRVHPGHARKMMAKMEALGYANEYLESTEGGHHGSVTNEQLATRLARTYAFLWQHLAGR
jgi:prolyl oligopeptidase